MNDPIVQEVRVARDRNARKFDYDVHAIFADARKRQGALGARLVQHKRQKKAAAK